MDFKFFILMFADPRRRFLRLCEGMARCHGEGEGEGGECVCVCVCARVCICVVVHACQVMLCGEVRGSSGVR